MLKGWDKEKIIKDWWCKERNEKSWLNGKVKKNVGMVKKIEKKLKENKK